MALLSPDPVMRFYDNNNNPLVGGQLFTYQAGTSTPVATYTDSSAGTPNSNPVILNARGEANVWLIPGQSYKFVLEDSLGNPIWSVDNINPAPSTGVVNTLTNVAGSNTITAICNGISQYQAGDIFSGMPASSNTGATTLNINGLGPVNVTIGGSALTGGEIGSGKPFVFYYTGSTFELFGMQGQVGDIAPIATSLVGIGNAAAFDARYAALAGLSTQVFAVATPANSTQATPRGYFEPINNTGAGADLTLQVGQRAYINVSASTSVFLHIATGDSQIHRIILNGDFTATAVAAGTTISPNNNSYASAFTCGYITEVGGAASTGSISLSSFGITVGSGANPYSADILCLNSTTNLKKVISSFQAGNTTNSDVSGTNWTRWNDTSTVWSSLGAITFVNAWSGQIIIERIA